MLILCNVVENLKNRWITALRFVNYVKAVHESFNCYVNLNNWKLSSCWKFYKV